MKYQVIVKDRERSWCLYFDNPDQARDMQADGFDISVVVNSIPEWVVDIGLLRPWCFVQDVLGWPLRMLERFRR